MFVIEIKRTKGAAERSRIRYVRAQEIVDTVAARLFGEQMQPTADLVYKVVPQGRSYAVVVDDPSL